MENFRPTITLDRFVKCFVSDDEYVIVFSTHYNSPNTYAYKGPVSEILMDKIDPDLANQVVCNIAVDDNALYIGVW